MKSTGNWSKRLLFCLLPLMVISSQSGCAWSRRHSEIAGALSDYWAWRAEKARFAEAKAEHERNEKAKAEANAYSEGNLEEVVKTDYTITLEKGMEIESMSLDFNEIDKMKAQQERLDKEYEKAMDAYNKLQANEERKRLANYMANAEAEAYGSSGCAPPPDCAQPPGVEKGMAPPPKRKALGMENLPIVIKARYSITPRQQMQSKTSIERRYQPGKGICQPPCEPCCPRCGDTPCTHTRAAAPSSGYVDSVHENESYRSFRSEPEAAPPSEVRSRSNRSRTDVERLDDFNLEPATPLSIGSGLFEGNIDPILLSVGN